VIASYNITFATPPRLESMEKWLELVHGLWLIVDSFKNVPFALVIILPNFPGLKSDTLPYYGTRILFFREAI